MADSAVPPHTAALAPTAISHQWVYMHCTDMPLWFFILRLLNIWSSW